MIKHLLFGTEPVTKYLHYEGKPAIPIPENGPWREALDATIEDMGGHVPKLAKEDTLEYMHIYAIRLGIFQYLVDHYPDIVPASWQADNLKKS